MAYEAGGQVITWTDQAQVKSKKNLVLRPSLDLWDDG